MKFNAKEFLSRTPAGRSLSELIASKDTNGIIKMMDDFGSDLLHHYVNENSEYRHRPTEYFNRSESRPKMILGPALSGKTRLSETMAQEYSPETVIRINGREIKPYPMLLEPNLRICETYTRLIIFDDMPEANFHQLWPLVAEQFLHINKMQKPPFKLTCDMIFIFDESVKKEKIPKTLLNRFEVIDLNNFFSKSGGYRTVKNH
ncbi:hypothetical protein [Jiulongibacter sp. NS-SX5]|uniref:hypothetical protein n=1 Tax=Jiulongibacter sp. NS-SX5 TaxID=3463854 RepID=UPI0040595E1D